MIAIPEDENLRWKLAEAMTDLAGMGWFVDTKTWSVFYPSNVNNLDDYCVPLDILFDESARCKSNKPKVMWDIAWYSNPWMKEMLLDWAKIFDTKFKVENYESEEDGNIFFTEENFFLEQMFILMYGHSENHRFDSFSLAIQWGWGQEKWRQKLLAIEETWYRNNVEYRKLSIVSRVLADCDYR